MAENQRWQALPTQLERAEFEQFVLPHLSMRPSRTWGENKNRTDTWRSEWNGRGGPDGQKQEAAASCSPPGFGRSHRAQMTLHGELNKVASIDYSRF
jgi:hypothetical protein